MNRKERQDAIESLLDQLKEIPISQLLESRLDIQRIAGSSKALCPFHDDRTIGSFHLHDGKNIYKCFSCDAGGDVVTFVRETEGLGFNETVLLLAYENALITQVEYEGLSHGKSIDTQKIRDRAPDTKVREPEQEAASIQWIDTVYRLMRSMSHLSPDHLAYLKEKRGLSDEQIERGGYFTMPSCTTRLIEVLETCLLLEKQVIGDEPEEEEEEEVRLRRQKEAAYEVLQGVPGFYKSGGKWRFVEHKNGIAIPIQDAYGRYAGIQIRNMGSGKKENRYTWFSSRPNDKQKREYGCGPGSPIDVVFPEMLTNQTVFVTEGRFKAEVLAEDKGSIVLSVQGINSWRDIEVHLESIAKSPITQDGWPDKDFVIGCVMVAYDNDLIEKASVMLAMMKLGEHLTTKRYPTYYLYWNSLKHKGIDDLILAGKADLVVRYAKEDWNESFMPFLEDLAEELREKQGPDEKPVRVPTIPKGKLVVRAKRHLKTLTPLEKGKISEYHRKLLRKEV